MIEQPQPPTHVAGWYKIALSLYVERDRHMKLAIETTNERVRGGELDLSERAHALAADATRFCEQYAYESTFVN